MTKQSATRVDGDRIVLTNATDERGILVPLTNVDVERLGRAGAQEEPLSEPLGSLLRAFAASPNGLGCPMWERTVRHPYAVRP
jgi:hypothetical protein